MPTFLGEHCRWAERIYQMAVNQSVEQMAGHSSTEGCVAPGMSCVLGALQNVCVCRCVHSCWYVPEVLGLYISQTWLSAGSLGVL